MGAIKQTKGRVGRQQRRQAPPAGDSGGKVSRQPAGQAPRRARDTCPCSGAARVQPRGCKGRSPLHKKTKNLPLPAGKGAGGMGAESKLKAGAAGDKQGKPPLRIPERQGQPTTSRASPPITPAPHIPPAGRRQCGRNPAGRRDSRRTPARPRRRKWRAERYTEHG